MVITTFELEDAKRLVQDAERLGFTVSRHEHTVRALIGESFKEKLDGQTVFRSLASRYYHTRTSIEDAGYFISRGVGSWGVPSDDRTTIPFIKRRTQ